MKKLLLLISFFSCYSLALSQVRTATQPLGQFAASIRSEAESLARIGYDAFRIDVASIAPGPIDKTYVLSPRDQIVLRVWGQLQLNYTLTVTDDLYIEIPDLPGRIYISGLPLSQLEERVRQQLATVYASYFNTEQPASSTAFVDISLAKVNDLRFLVQGEVGTPGSYSLHPSLGNIIYALARAGGVKLTGSLRNIKIRRGEQLISFDFYDFLIRGNVTVSQTQIRNNDVIFVPLKRKEVTIKGEVKRPGVYELLEASGEDLETLIDLAGGFRPSANLDKLLILRTEMNVGVKTMDVNLTRVRGTAEKILLQDQDIVTVFPTYQVRLDYVSVRGRGVAVAGEYQLKPGMRITNLIEEAGGLLRDAYMERADLVRTRPDMTKIYQQLDLRKAVDKTGGQNLVLQPLDELVIYNVREIEGEQKFITLSGRVKFPGRYEYYRGMKLYDLLFGRGGFQDKDFLRDTYLERADLLRAVPGQARKELIRFNLGKLLEGDQSANIELLSEDEIVVYSQQEILGGDRFVTLSGQAKNKGRQRLYQGMTLADLLYTVGGYRDPDYRREAYQRRGDLLRQVVHEGRLDKELIRFDLGALLDGDAKQNVELQSGDEVILYAAKDFEEKRYVFVDGEVNLPGRYELARNMTLEDLVIRGGGLKDAADPSVAEVARMDLSNPEVRVQTLKVQLSDRNFALHTGDRVLIRSRAGYQAPRVVEVQGEVLYPGRYTLIPGSDRLSDLIQMAGGLRPGAHLPASELVRFYALENEHRVVIDLARALKDPSSAENIVLFDGDSLSVPIAAGTVQVEGEVRNPVTLSWREGKGLDYYLKSAGGYTDDANRYGVTVVLPSGRTSTRGWWPFSSPPVEPGSIIKVPSLYSTTTTSTTTTSTTTTTTTTTTSTTEPERMTPQTPVNIYLPTGAPTTLPPAPPTTIPRPAAIPSATTPTTTFPPITIP